MEPGKPVPALLVLAEVLHKAGNTREAVQALECVLQHGACNAERELRVRAHLAGILLSSGCAESARRTLEQGAGSSSSAMAPRQQANLWRVLSTARAACGDRQGAIDAARKSIEIGRRHRAHEVADSAALQLADLYRRAGDADAAIQSLLEAAQAARARDDPGALAAFGLARAQALLEGDSPLAALQAIDAGDEDVPPPVGGAERGAAGPSASSQGSSQGSAQGAQTPVHPELHAQGIMLRVLASLRAGRPQDAHASLLRLHHAMKAAPEPGVSPYSWFPSVLARNSFLYFLSAECNRLHKPQSALKFAIKGLESVDAGARGAGDGPQQAGERAFLASLRGALLSSLSAIHLQAGNLVAAVKAAAGVPEEAGDSGELIKAAACAAAGRLDAAAERLRALGAGSASGSGSAARGMTWRRPRRRWRRRWRWRRAPRGPSSRGAWRRSSGWPAGRAPAARGPLCASSRAAEAPPQAEERRGGVPCGGGGGAGVGPRRARGARVAGPRGGRRAREEAAVHLRAGLAALEAARGAHDEPGLLARLWGGLPGEDRRRAEAAARHAEQARSLARAPGRPTNSRSLFEGLRCAAQVQAAKALPELALLCQERAAAGPAATSTAVAGTAAGKQPKQQGPAAGPGVAPSSSAPSPKRHKAG
eukprot:tig00000076_g2444.t1